MTKKVKHNPFAEAVRKQRDLLNGTPPKEPMIQKRSWPEIKRDF